MRREAAGIVVLACLLLTVTSSPAHAWAVKAHLFIANTVMEDLADGKLTVRAVETGPGGERLTVDPPLGEIEVPPDIVQAIMNNRAAFRAGAAGPDGYPDIYFGQSIIHPYEPGQPWRAIDWGRHLLERARDYEDGESRERAIAFAYGFLVHIACDAIGHTWVNSHSGGAWDWGNMTIVTTHVSLESYVNSKLPETEFEGDPDNINVDSGFLTEALLLDDDTQSSVVRAGYLKALVDYWDFFDRAQAKIDRLLDRTWNIDISGGALSAMRSALRHQRGVAWDALNAWINTSTATVGDLAQGSYIRIPGYVSDWIWTWTPQLMGVPGGVLTALEYLGWPMSVVSDWLNERFMQLLEEVYNALLRDTFEALTDPQVFLDQTQTPEARERIYEEMALDRDAGVLNPDMFYALYDSIALSKLCLMDGDAIGAVGAALGVTIPWSGSDDHILYDCVNSLDASNQLGLYPPFRLLETPELTDNAYKRLFKGDPYAASPSSIDPAHLFVYSDGTGGLVFATPVLDPCNEGSRIVAYVYQENEGGGADVRTPFSESGIPTLMAEGCFTSLIRNDPYLPATGRSHRYHLATALAQEGSNELLEDRGVDIVVDEATPWTARASALPPEQVSAMVTQMLIDAGVDPAGLPPGGLTEEHMEGVANQWYQAQLDAMDQTIQGFEQAIAQAQADGNAQTATALAQQLQATREARQRLIDQGPPGGRRGQTTEGPGEPFVYNEHMLTGMTEALRNGELTRDTSPPSLPGDDTGQWSDFLGNSTWLIGTVTDEAGQPLENATVTLVERTIFDQLRAVTGVPEVRFQDWYLQGLYLFGRTNPAGQYLIPFSQPHDYILVASAPGFAKREVPVTVTVGEAPGALLDPVALSREPTEGASEQTSPTTSGQPAAHPGIIIETDPPLVNWEQADADGVAEVRVRLTAIGGLAGTLSLSLEDLPHGVTAEPSPDTVEIAETAEAVIRLTAEEGAAGAGRARLVAECGGVTQTVPLYVALGLGTLGIEGDELRLSPGEDTTFKLRYDGEGQAPRVFVDELPRGLSVRVRAVKQNRDVEPLTVDALTVPRAQEAAEALRPLIPAIAAEPPVLIAVTEEEVRAAPRRALTLGVLLAPEGWLEVTLAASEDIEPGEYGIPVRLQYGENYVVRKVVTVTIE